MIIDKEKLKFVLDNVNPHSVFTQDGQKIRWDGVVGDRVLSYTTNHFLSNKSTQKWIEYVNSVKLPAKVKTTDLPKVDDTPLEDIVKARRKRKSKDAIQEDQQG